MTAHDFARQLLNGPDKPLLIHDYEGNLIEVEPELLQIDSDYSEDSHVCIDLENAS